ncbi:MAG: spondin domain-containing protein [Acidobacteriota bacterium]|nr:spondin domain-containing protein [Acidobacteriota bacterium]
MKRVLILAMFVAVIAGAALPAAAQYSATVYITNLSQQIISPPVVASHTWKVAVFAPGQPASSDLAALAEDGDGSGLVDLLSEHAEVFDVAAAAGPILPGETVVLQLQFRGKYNRFSAVGMLVTSNDAFFGLNSYFIDPSQKVHRTVAPAWDAGSEANNELCDFIPGPPCGNPFMRATDGAEGFVSIHSGIHGTGDLLPSEWAWQNPVVEIAVIMN